MRLPDAQALGSRDVPRLGERGEEGLRIWLEDCWGSGLNVVLRDASVREYKLVSQNLRV